MQEVISGHLLGAAEAYARGGRTAAALDGLAAAVGNAAAGAAREAVGGWAPEVLHHIAGENADEEPRRGALASICAAVQACLVPFDHTSA